MILCGMIKLYNENLNFALPVFKGKDDNYYIQDSDGKQDIIKKFIQLKNINENVFKGLSQQIEKNIEDDILYIFITHNGETLIGSKAEIAGSLDECYRQVFPSVLELMGFLGKEKQLKKIEKYLFPEYMNNEQDSTTNDNSLVVYKHISINTCEKYSLTNVRVGDLTRIIAFSKLTLTTINSEEHIMRGT